METDVLVRVLPDSHGSRQIGRTPDVVERLVDRAEDVKEAVAAGAATLSQSLPGIIPAEGWDLSEVSASFGVSLTAEAGVIVAKAEAGASFEVTVTFARGE